jgi:hypothetical protein
VGPRHGGRRLEAVANTSYIYWSTSATSTPIDDVLAERFMMKLNGKRKPNTLVLGALVKQQLVTHPQIIGRLNNGQTPGSARAGDARGPREAVRSRSRPRLDGRVQLREGVGHGLQRVHLRQQERAALLRRADPGVMTPSAGYRFAWQGIAGNAMGIRNWKYFDQPMPLDWYIEIGDQRRVRADGAEARHVPLGNHRVIHGEERRPQAHRPDQGLRVHRR